MFLKPFRVKSNTTCKSSERKRLRGRICSSYPSLPQASLDELLPSKYTLASIRVFTHGNSNVTIFTVDDQPLFFDYEDYFCPTVYALWKCPEMLPSASTGPYVFTKLQGGADLMLPGVILPKSEVPDLTGVEKGQLCSISLVGNRASFGVGVALMSYDTMEANQWRGKGFKMLHLYGDHLWELGSKGDPPLLLPQMQVAEAEATSGESRDQSLRESGDHLLPIPSSKKAEVGTDSSGGNMGKNLKVPFDVTCAADVNVTTGCTEATCCLTSDESSPSSLGQKPADTEIDDNVESMAIAEVVKFKPTPSGSQLSEDMKDDALSETVKKYCPEKLEDESDLDDQSNKDLCETTESTAPPMDDLLYECFYMAIKSSIKKDDLPVLTSTFYRSHMMPLCPPGLSLDIKKSTYKKLSKFLSAMQDEGVVKVKEVSKGVESIAEIDFKHIKVKGLVPKYVNSAMKTIGESTPASATSVASNTAGRAPQMIITELYIPSRKVFPIFSPYGYSTSTMMTHSMVREVVTRYIKERELTSTTNSRLVILDPILTDAILKKGEVLPTELPWQQIMSRILEEMRPGYSIQQGADKLYKRTKLEPVRLSVTTRTGNKKATLVDNLDYYGISPADVVHQIQRIAAASATVNEVSGRPQRQQVMVQGSNVKVIAKLLEEQHGVPLKYIEAVDRTKLPKTQKRQGSKR